MNYLHKFGFHVFQRRESSFSSSNERRSLLPAIKPTDTMVHCTPSNKNQSASFRILFFFWNFKFFFFLYLSNVTAHDFYTVDQEQRKFLEISTLRICMLYLAYKFTLPLCFEFRGWEEIINQIAYGILWKSTFSKRVTVQSSERFISSRINAILRRYFQFFLSKSIVPFLSFNYLDARYVNSIFTRRETKCNQVEVFIITYSYTASNWKTY